MKPRISCIIPVFNDRDRLPAAVASVLGQLADVQVIVVDDGSLDGTAEVGEDLSRADSRVEVVALGKNMGQAVARNVGLSCADGKFVTFLDSDDIHAEGYYAHALHVLERSAELAAVRGHAEFVLPDGAGVPLARSDPRYDAILNSSACTLVVDRQVAGAIGFPANAFFRQGGEDIVFTRTLLNEFRVAQIDSVALRVLVKAGGHTARYLFGTAIAGLPPVDSAVLTRFNKAAALAIAERQDGIEALVRRRDRKR